MDELIQKDLDEARFISTGRFTLSASQQKMLRSRLGEPEEMVLLLIRWASLQGARSCRIRSSARQLEFAYEQPALSLDELANQLNSLSCLSMVVVAALSLSPSSLTLEVAEGTWTPSRLLRKAGAKGFRLGLSLPFWRKARLKPLEDWLQRFLLHSTLEVWHQGRKVNVPRDFSRQPATWARRGPGVPLPEFLPGRSHQTLDWELPMSVVVGVLPGDYEEQLQGVSLQRPGRDALVVAPSAAVDASGWRPVSDLERDRKVDELWYELSQQPLSFEEGEEVRLLRCQVEYQEQLGIASPATLERWLELVKVKQAREQDEILPRLALAHQARGEWNSALLNWETAFQRVRSLRHAEGWLNCLALAGEPLGEAGPALAILLESRQKIEATTWQSIALWLWDQAHWDLAFLAHQAWLSQEKSSPLRRQCLERLVELARRLGRRLDEENYAAQLWTL